MPSANNSLMNSPVFAAPPGQPVHLTGQPFNRRVVIALVVVALHAGLIWALQRGLTQHPPEQVIPAEVLAELIEPPAPQAAPAPPAPPVPPSKPVKTAPAPSPQKTPPKAPAPTQPQAQPLAIADATPSPNAPAGSLASAPPAAAAPVAAGPAAAPPAAPSAPAAVQLPSSNADYLQNPKPAYPPLSRRLGEQGKVIVRVLIGADGVPRKAELHQSSGFDRLDRAALDTTLKWRYVPGKRGGMAEEMWFNVPINFVLE